MESEKTVKQLCNELCRVTDCDGDIVSENIEFSDLIFDAHCREIDSANAKIARLRECLYEALTHVCYTAPVNHSKWRRVLEETKGVEEDVR